MVFMRTVVLCFVLAAVVNAQTIGFKTTLSAAGMEYLKNIGLEVLENSLSSISLPDINGTPIGDVSYSLTDIVMKGLTIPNSTLTLVPPNSVEIDISNTAATMSLNWHYKQRKIPHISDSGSADVSISSTTIGVEIAVSETNGVPSATTTACNVSIGHLSIDVHGGAGWLYNWFISMFSGSIKSSAESSLRTQIPISINQGLASALSSLPLTSPINSKVEINYQLEAQPAITASYFCLSALGEFYDIQNPQQAPFTPAALPDIVTAEMVQMFISDFTLNTASFVFYSENQMTYTVTDSMLPSSAPLRLNTSYFIDMIPAFYKAYPNQMFELYIYAVATPVASFSSTGAYIVANGNIDVVMLPNKNVAFTLGVQILTAGTAALNSLNITGSLSFVNLTLSLVNSTIGSFNVTVLNQVVGFLVTDAIIPYGNKILGAGFPLPTVNGLSFIEPSIGWGPGYLYVSTDAVYVPGAAAAKAIPKVKVL